MKKESVAVEFQPEGRSFRPLIFLGDVLDGDRDAQALGDHSLAVYGSRLKRLRSIMSEIRSMRQTRTRIPARKVWDFGNEVFALTQQLAEVGTEIDDLYGHLERDVPAKRKWVEKAIILRRYVEDRNTIPEVYHWGMLEKGTARKAKLLVRK